MAIFDPNGFPPNVEPCVPSEDKKIDEYHKKYKEVEYCITNFTNSTPFV